MLKHEQLELEAAAGGVALARAAAAGVAAVTDLKHEQ